MTQPVFDLACELIRRPSVTPDDARCQQLLSKRLAAIGFSIEQLPFADVNNFWALKKPSRRSPVLVFAGHTDVVPPGDLELWTSPPFEPTVRGERLYGRGAADMKSSLAAMIVACERFLAKYPRHQGGIGLLITSDEEGAFVNGTTRVVDALKVRGERLDFCIVGEPSADRILGDRVRNGRRGSLSGHLVIHGVQGHIAYPELSINAVHSALTPLMELTRTCWDKGNQYFPATHFQISNITAGIASNIVPGRCEVEFNLRFSNEYSSATLKARVEAILVQTGVDYDLSWTVNGEPFLTPPGELSAAVEKSVGNVCGICPTLSTGGGTSDGRFIATTGAQVLEVGPPAGSIHRPDEHILIRDLEKLAEIYEHILVTLIR